MGYYGFYIFGIVGPIFISYLLISGAVKLQRQTDPEHSPWLSKYQEIVSIVMFVAGILALCSICLVILSWSPS